MSITVNKTGFCPTQREDYEVQVLIVEVPILGSSKANYKSAVKYCKYAEEKSCSIYNERRCPIGLNCRP